MQSQAQNCAWWTMGESNSRNYNANVETKGRRCRTTLCVDLPRIELGSQQCLVRKNGFVDPGGIEPPPMQCECIVLPLNYEPILLRTGCFLPASPYCRKARRYHRPKDCGQQH